MTVLITNVNHTIYLAISDRSHTHLSIVTKFTTDVKNFARPLQFFSTEKKFEEAIDYYSQAIDLNPNVAVYYGNRSFAYLKMESYGYALLDASKALELDRTYVKVSD